VERVALNKHKILGQTPPSPPSAEGFAEILEAIRTETDYDSFKGALAGILRRRGFEEEALRVLQYQSIFCP
jgi:hypothetical protein